MASAASATAMCLIGPDITTATANEARDRYFQHIRTKRVASDPTVSWNNVGPGMSGYVEGLWTHPTDPEVIFLGPDMHVSYGSWDAGESWQSIRNFNGLGDEMKRVLDIEFSRQDPDFGMAIDWNGWLYRTQDRGRRWVKVSELSPIYKDVGADPFDPEAFRKGWYDEQLGTRLSKLAVDPANDKIWYIGAGDFWNVKENHKSAAAPYGVHNRYADYGYILKSVDRGASWTRLTNGLPADLDVGKIIIDPNLPNRIIIQSNHGIFRSGDGGRTWQSSAQGLPHNLPRDLTSFRDSATGRFTLFTVEQTVFAADGRTVRSIGGVFRSDDSGNS